jgi:hypothetical protein
MFCLAVLAAPGAYAQQGAGLPSGIPQSGERVDAISTTPITIQSYLTAQRVAIEAEVWKLNASVEPPKPVKVAPPPPPPPSLELRKAPKRVAAPAPEVPRPVGIMLSNGANFAEVSYAGVIYVVKQGDKIGTSNWKFAAATPTPTGSQITLTSGSSKQSFHFDNALIPVAVAR